MRRFIFSLATAAISCLPLAPAFAQETPVVSLELNNAADTDEDACRLTYVATNKTGPALVAMSYQVAVFDTQGIVSDLLVLEFGDLAGDKTKVVQFDLGGRGCADISRITVNQIAECALVNDAEISDFCMLALKTSSRSPIQFGM